MNINGTPGGTQKQRYWLTHKGYAALEQLSTPKKQHSQPDSPSTTTTTQENQP